MASADRKAKVRDQALARGRLRIGADWNAFPRLRDAVLEIESQFASWIWVRILASEPRGSLTLARLSGVS